MALHLAAYNFTRVHKSLRCTPAMKLGVTGRVWTVGDLTALAGWYAGPVPEVTIDALREAIRNLHGCDSTFVETVPVVERFRGQTVWEGAVVVFDLIGHPKATRAYAWSTDVPGTKRRRFVAVLHIPPVGSPAAAVRASIVASRKATAGSRKPKRGRWRRRKFLDDHPGTGPTPPFFPVY